MTMRRRTLLTGCAATAAAGVLAPLRSAAGEGGFGDWRLYEIVTRIALPPAKGAVRLWVPAPEIDAGWAPAKRSTFSTNAIAAHRMDDGTIVAEWLPGAPAPTLEAATLGLISQGSGNPPRATIRPQVEMAAGRFVLLQIYPDSCSVEIRHPSVPVVSMSAV